MIASILRRRCRCLWRVMGLGGLCLWVASTLATLAADPVVRVSRSTEEDSSTWNSTHILGFRVTLRHPHDYDAAASEDPIRVGPPGRAWPSAVRLRVVGPDGRDVTWPWVASGETSTAPYPIYPESEPFMLFFLPDSPDRRAVPGVYQVVATLEIRDGTNWVGQVESPPYALTVEPPPPAAPGLAISLAGGVPVAVGDPWVVQIQLTAPLDAPESALRTGYRLRVFDDAGREQPLTFDPVVPPRIIPPWWTLRDQGLFPVLAVLPPAAAAALNPGTYRLEATWSGTGGPVLRSGSLSVPVVALGNVGTGPDRERTRRDQSMVWALSLLRRAETASAADADRLVRQAAPLVLDAETRLLQALAREPFGAELATAFAEVRLLEGDFSSARAFATLARSFHAPANEAFALFPDPTLGLLDALDTGIEEAAQVPVFRLMPPLLDAARNPSQWAVAARASSEYRAQDYSAAQATGEPNVRSHGDNARAWAPRTADAPEEWLELTYARPVPAIGVRVVQSFNPGAIIRIDVLDPAGQPTTVWTGPDTNAYVRGQIGILAVSFPATAQPVEKVRITMDTRLVPGWNEIDAVQLIEAKSPPPVVRPTLAFRVIAGDAATLEIPAWPQGFQLQRATRLSPADWAAFPATPPVRIPIAGAPAFFRLVAAPSP